MVPTLTWSLLAACSSSSGGANPTPDAAAIVDAPTADAAPDAAPRPADVGPSLDAALPQDAMDEINQIETRHRLNQVVKTGSPGFIPQGA